MKNSLLWLESNSITFFSTAVGVLDRAELVIVRLILRRNFNSFPRANLSSPQILPLVVVQNTMFNNMFVGKDGGSFGERAKTTGHPDAASSSDVEMTFEP